MWGVYKTLARPLFDTDLWWQLNAGRFMLETHTFLRTETFSHTMSGIPWVNFEWLSQIVLAQMVQWGGLTSILYGKIGAGFLVMGSLVFLLRTVGARGPLLVLLTTVGFLALKPRFYERVELVTLIFLPLLLALLLLARTKDFFRRSSWLVFFFGFMVLWVNLHGGFVTGLGTVLLLSCGARLAHEDRQVIVFYDRVFLCFLVALLVNPFGVRLVDVFIDHAVQLGGTPLIEEWVSPSVIRYPVFWFLFIVGAVGLTWSFFNRQSEAMFWGPLVFVVSLWGSRHERSTFFLSFFVLPFLVEAFKTAFQIYRPPLLHALRAFCFVPLLFLNPDIRKPMSPLIVQENRFPFGACEFLKKNNIQGVMYNTYQLGGAIEWALGASTKVFMDGRYLFHPLLVEHARLDSELTFQSNGDAWAKFLKTYGVDMAVVEYVNYELPSRGTPFPLTWINLVFPRSDWALVYWDDASLVFLKRIPRFAEPIKIFEYKSLWPYNLEQMKALLLTQAVSRDEALKELKKQQAQVPISFLRVQLQELIDRD